MIDKRKKNIQLNGIKVGDPFQRKKENRKEEKARRDKGMKERSRVGKIKRKVRTGKGCLNKCKIKWKGTMAKRRDVKEKKQDDR